MKMTSTKRPDFHTHPTGFPPPYRSMYHSQSRCSRPAAAGLTKLIPSLELPTLQFPTSVAVGTPKCGPDSLCFPSMNAQSLPFLPCAVPPLLLRFLRQHANTVCFSFSLPLSLFVGMHVSPYWKVGSPVHVYPGLLVVEDQ